MVFSWNILKNNSLNIVISIISPCVFVCLLVLLLLAYGQVKISLHLTVLNLMFADVCSFNAKLVFPCYAA